MRAVFCTLPFKRITARMMVELVKFSTMWLNAFPANNGVTTEYSPREIVLGTKLDWKLHCRMPFGGYTHVHEDPLITNENIQPRTVGAICLGPTGNCQGTYRFLGLKMNDVLRHHSFRELPMPDRVARRDHYFSRKTKNADGITFYNRSKTLIDDGATIVVDATGVDDNESVHPLPPDPVPVRH